MKKVKLKEILVECAGIELDIKESVVNEARSKLSIASELVKITLKMEKLAKEFNRNPDADRSEAIKTELRDLNPKAESLVAALEESTVNESKLPKRFTVKTKQTLTDIGGIKTIYPTGNYALTSKRGNTGLYKNIDTNQLIGANADDITKLSESTVNEASLSKVYNAAKKGSYPITLVAIENGKVVDQKIVGAREIVPAAFNDMQKEFPQAQVNIEDRTGKILFKEANLTGGQAVVEAKSGHITIKKSQLGKYDSVLDLFNRAWHEFVIQYAKQHKIKWKNWSDAEYKVSSLLKIPASEDKHSEDKARYVIDQGFLSLTEGTLENIYIKESIKVGDKLTLLSNGKEGKVIKIVRDVATVDFGGQEVYGIMFSRIKGDKILESYSDEQRMELADKGFALSDGSYPIKNLQDLKNAIMAYGRAKDQPRTAKFIVKRAKALHADDLIPDTADFQKSIKESINEDNELSKLFQMSKHADIRMGEDKLYKLAMAWESWNVDNDDKYDRLVDGLFTAVELIQNNNSADERRAKGILKKFNKDIVRAMGLHNESIEEGEAYKSASRNELAQYIINLQDEIKAYKQRGNKKYAEGSARDLEEVRAELASRK
jgi:hypothetical protein